MSSSDNESPPTSTKPIQEKAVKKKTAVTKVKAVSAKSATAVPAHPKYSVMITDIIKNCGNTRAGVSR